ncbi:EXOC8 [Cordylochernes scorpioides]|uniref:Exocyst complex component 8 n=1 Tax=Cordylochernes scorpioides TaxID=51811 RepID=A0ABY6KQW0_9ARAC|nr:EXOC8 [Cordylochernes scorpioides]
MEGEMLQLSHLLTEQQAVINSLLDISITRPVTAVGPEKSGSSNTSPMLSPDKEEENKRALSTLLEKVEGCSTLLEGTSRYIIYSGDLTEVNAVGLHTMHRVYAVLLNDSFLIATLLPHRKGPVRYKYQTLYELENLAIVNVKDDSSKLKNCFKLLMFPDTRYFQCDSAFAKNEWMKHIEETKKNKELFRGSLTSLSRHKLKIFFLISELKDFFFLISELKVFFFLISELKECPKAKAVEENNNNKEVEAPDWLQELPEDLDVNIAQRDFEAAVNLIKKAEKFILKNSDKNNIKEIGARIEQRKKNLVAILTAELKVSPGLQGGPRSARRAVGFLIQLERSCQACELFLQHRRAILKHSLRQQQMEGATAVYIRRLATHFFNNLQETAKEFHQAFYNKPNCASSKFLSLAQNTV